VLGAARLIMAVEDHGAGNQLIRVRWWPSLSATALMPTAGMVALSIAAGFDGGWSVAAALGLAAACVVVRAACQCGAAVAAIEHTVAETGSTS
jgi:O-antigen biosynthesis protein